jgi:hypothetical protein
MLWVGCEADLSSRHACLLPAECCFGQAFDDAAQNGLVLPEHRFNHLWGTSLDKISEQLRLIRFAQGNKLMRIG